MNSLKKAVIFGGSGFLGSHVAEELTKDGYEVVICDIMTSAHLRPQQKMELVDIMDARRVEEVVEGSSYVYNFAGLADIGEAHKKPLLTAQLNINGNLHILEAARKAKVKRFVFASTVYVYGESGSFYRASKQASEKFVELYYENFGLPFTILRYGSLYGRRSDGRNTIHQFIEEALKKGTMTYPGSGKELREYIHVADAARVSVQILASEFENQHLVITGHQQHRVADVMAMISEILQNKVQIRFGNAEQESHYTITPYTYKPRLGKKIVANPFIDMGQGVLDCIHEQAESGKSGKT